MKGLVIYPKSPRGEDGYCVFSIRIPKKAVTKLETIVQRTGRTRNELICLFLKYALENCIVQDDSPGA